MPATPTAAPVDCPSCGQPPGECYNLCPLSPAFYSPEQEREDDLNWSRSDYLRETYGDPDLDAEPPTDDYGVAVSDFAATPVGPVDEDDIPF